jgi:hypothetical protein
MAKAEDYVGMTKKDAQNKAEADNLVFRLVSVDGETFLGLPEDVREDRVCVVIKNGKVEEATIQ